MFIKCNQEKIEKSAPKKRDSKKTPERCCQTQTVCQEPAGVTARKSGGSKDKDNDDDQGGDIPAWMFNKCNQEKIEKSAPKKRDSKKKSAQPKENDDPARRSLKVKEGTTEE